MKTLDVNKMTAVKANGLCAVLFTGGWLAGCLIVKAAL